MISQFRSLFTGQTFLSFDLTNVTSERAAAGANKQSYDNGTCTVPSVIQISISLILHQHSVRINQGMFLSPTSNMPSLYCSQISHTQNDDQPQEAHQACKEVAKSSCLEKEKNSTARTQRIISSSSTSGR
ncbi:hypothetical protein LWI29_028167 [Acer saccharum]|uniref:Uncharacterized protein n=1 Tax=Acer saccharum TaxID=4024 RepID=A0AA39VDL2_ACESA|nr:hypothetical protein LWI29_028167 [Acer saccharum]